MSDKPTTVAVATYPNEATATMDYDSIRGVKHAGQLDHLAIAFVERDAKGKLKIDRHDSTAKHLAWGGGVLGGALMVISAPLGVVFLGPLAVTAGAWAAAGGLVGHFWDNIPKDEVRRMTDLLETGEFGLVVVAVNPKGADIGALLSNATEKTVVDGVTDVDGALDEAFARPEVES
ncbi:MAG: hypothetical protein WBL35_15395 [Ornithinibacter sp.]